MDIAKYIGLFLLKNNFVYLHGFGNLELKKKPATYDGEALHAPAYDVMLTPGGSIDDTLANFIATHEQTSISKAANALREFSTATRAELAAGKDVEVPGIGKFVEVNGLVRFVANQDLRHVPTPVPMIRMAKRTEEQPDFRRESQEDASRSEIAWGKIILLGLLALLIIAGAIVAFRYFRNNNSEPAAAARPDTVETQQPALIPPPIDSSVKPDTATTAVPPAPQPIASAGDYIVVLNTYPSRVAAERRAGSLLRNGNKVEVLARDSATFFVVTHMPQSSADTTRMLDSLRRFFNPKGVHILR